MAAVQPIRKQSYEQVYLLLKTAIEQRRCLSARYRGYFRLLCPHVLGRNSMGAPQVLAYQYGGESASGLGPRGSPDNWRCIAIEKLTGVALVDDPWITPPNYSQSQSCVVEIEFDTQATRFLSAEAAE